MLFYVLTRYDLFVDERVDSSKNLSSKEGQVQDFLQIWFKKQMCDAPASVEFETEVFALKE